MKKSKFYKWFDKFSIKTNGAYSNSDYEYLATEVWNAACKSILRKLKKLPVSDDGYIDWHNFYRVEKEIQKMIEK